MRNLTSILIVAALAGFVACQSVEPVYSDADKTCTLTLSSYTDNTSTIVTKSGTTDAAWDTLVSDVQYIVYRKALDGSFKYYDKKHDTTRIHRKFVNCVPGDYRIYAVINGPDINANTTEQALNATDIPLGTYNTRVRISAGEGKYSGGFVMFGHSDVTISAGNEDVHIAVKRHLARVNLVGIKNDTEDQIPIKFRYAFLSNVVCNQVLNGDITSSPTQYQWDNLRGRVNGTVLNYDNVDASAQDKHLTLYKPAQSVTIGYGTTSYFNEKFYGYPNATATDSFDVPSVVDGAVTPTSGKTRLVVVCSMHDQSEPDEKDYYFPITFNSATYPFDRSYTYDVTLTVLGIGSEDPNTLVNKAGMRFTIDPWISGQEYSESY